MKNNSVYNKKWAIVKYAYENSYFYKKAIQGTERISDIFAAKKWDELPVIRKEMFIENPSSLLSDDYVVADYQNELVTLFTSGTTGTCLNVKWAGEDANRSLSALWLRRFHECGIRAHDRYCYFFCARDGRWSHQRYDKTRPYALGIYSGGLTLEKVREVYEEIRKFSPKWLLLQPSIAELIGRAKEKYGLPDLPELVYVELTGEMLLTGQKQRMEDLFHCQVRNQYGCNEAFSIAYECHRGKMHCDDTNVYIEVLDKEGNLLPDGETGDICVTSLNNYAMPFIRYLIGDRGKIYHDYKCDCGKTGTVVELTEGRSSEMLQLRNGEQLSAFIFAKAVNNINEIWQEAIYQYQVIQKGVGKFEIVFVADEEINRKEILEVFLDRLNEPLLNEAAFEFRFQDSIMTDEGTGKVRSFQRR